MALPIGLLDAAKNELDITYNDTATDQKLQGSLERGIKSINEVAGAELDYSVEDKPREMLYQYIRYDRAGRLNEFKRDYLHELYDLQITQRMVADADV